MTQFWYDFTLYAIALMVTGCLVALLFTREFKEFLDGLKNAPSKTSKAQAQKEQSK